VANRVRETVELEMTYPWGLPQTVLGLNGDLFRDCAQHIADRRLGRIGLPAQYGSVNPFPWISESTDLGKEKTSLRPVSPNTNRPSVIVVGLIRTRVE
jgi:ribonucleoside-diphosphate reductase beta chain